MKVREPVSSIACFMPASTASAPELQKTTGSPRPPARQLTRQLASQRVSRALRVDRSAFGQQALRFRTSTGCDGRTGVPVPAHQIQHRDFLAVAVVEQIVALSPVEDHANAQQIEQPTELRLDHLVRIVGPDGSMGAPERIPDRESDGGADVSGCLARQGLVGYAGAHIR